MKPLTAVLAIGLLGAVATTISPTQHDFGRWAVGASSPAVQFRVTLPPGATLADSIAVSFAGADAGDFDLGAMFTRVVSMRIACGASPPHLVAPHTPGTCLIPVQFWPTSIGPKSARLQIVDKTGAITTASLRGTGVAALCEMKVVSCNYAHLYSGSFSWQTGLSGQYGQNQKTITVNVINGRATCNGSETDVNIDDRGNRTTQVGTILGAGLIAIEFEKDSTGKDVYRITGACPSPYWPPTPDQPARASTPAELGSSYYEQSYQQPMPPGSTGSGVPNPAALRGGNTYPNPEADPANGVTGTIRVTWAFSRS